MEITSGFLVVKTFERMYQEYLNMFEKWRQDDFPNCGPKLIEQMQGKYSGIYRDPIQSWSETFRDSGIVEPTEQELNACLFMWELEDLKKADEDYIFDLKDAIKLLKMIPQPVEREIIWAGRIDKNNKPPSETKLLGYEPTNFYPDCHGSVLADNAFFVYCRTEQERYVVKQLDKFHANLNKWGLFNSATDAKKYKDFILELVPDEHEGIEYIAEIRLLR